MRLPLFRFAFRCSVALLAALVVAGIGDALRESRSLPPLELDYTRDVYASVSERNDKAAIERLTMAAKIDWHAQRPKHLFELAKIAARSNDQHSLQWAIHELRIHARQGTGDPLAPYYFSVALLLTRGPTAAEIDEAYDHCLAAAKQAPDNADIYSHLGIICSLRGNPDLAVRCFRHALSLDPSNQVAEFGLRQTLATSSTSEPQQP